MTEPMILRVRLAAPIAAVRHALTDAASPRHLIGATRDENLIQTHLVAGLAQAVGEAPTPWPMLPCT